MVEGNHCETLERIIKACRDAQRSLDENPDTARHHVQYAFAAVTRLAHELGASNEYRK